MFPISKQGELFDRDKVQESINILRFMEPPIEYHPNGYWLAFSGGKDSVVIKQLAIEAGVRFKAHYNVTTLDPPELVRFIRKYHRDVICERPSLSFRKMCIKENMLPTRRARFCCKYLKESSGNGGIIVGVRAAESARRAKYDTIGFSYKSATTLFIRPILNWTDADVWGFIQDRHLPYCELYDQGRKRIGCLFCPMASVSQRNKDLIQYPKHAERIKAIAQAVYNARLTKGKPTIWKSGDDLFAKWINDQSCEKPMPLFNGGDYSDYWGRKEGEDGL